MIEPTGEQQELNEPEPIAMDSWTVEEMDLLAAEDAELLGWEGMESYQDASP